MKRLLSILFMFGSLSVFAASPSFQQVTNTLVPAVLARSNSYGTIVSSRIVAANLNVTTNNWQLTNAQVTVNGGLIVTNAASLWGAEINSSGQMIFRSNAVAKVTIDGRTGGQTNFQNICIQGASTTDDVTIGLGSIYMDSSGNTSIIMDRGAYNRTAQVQFNSTPQWYMGMPDSDNDYDPYSFFIGNNSGGGAPIFRVSTNKTVTIDGSVIATNGFTLPTDTSYITFTAGVLTNPPVAGAANAYIFAGTNAASGGDVAHLYVMDGSGEMTQISPHASDAPESLLDATDEYPMVSKESNLYLGHARWINQSREARRVEQLLHAVQILIGGFDTNGLSTLQLARLRAISSLTPAQKDIVSVQTNYTPRLSWAAVQAGIQTRYANSYTNAMDNFNIAWNEYLQAIISGDTNAVAPIQPTWAPPPVQPVPKMLAERGVQ